eukprot:1195618-Pyramimonas_sp.AAC.1
MRRRRGPRDHPRRGYADGPPSLLPPARWAPSGAALCASCEGARGGQRTGRGGGKAHRGA